MSEIKPEEMKNLLKKSFLPNVIKTIVLAVLVGAIGFIGFRYGKVIYFAIKFENQVCLSVSRYQAERSKLVNAAEKEAELNFKESMTALGSGKK